MAKRWKPRSIVLITVLIVALLAGAAFGVNYWLNRKPDVAPSLLMERTVAAIDVGKGEEFAVHARDKEFKNVTFSAKGDSACMNATATKTGVWVNSTKAGCSGNVTVSAPSIGLTRSMQVHVIDPMVMDLGSGLLMRYTNDYDLVLSGQGEDPFAFLHPKVPDPSWHRVGDAIIHGLNVNDAKQVPTILLKDSKNLGLLAEPTEYQLMWSDRTPFGGGDNNLWLPKCPAGFKALSIAVHHNVPDEYTPTKGHMSCVRQDFTSVGTHPGLDKDFITDNYKSIYASAGEWAVWRIHGPNVLHDSQNRVPFPVPGLVLACPHWGPKDCADQMSVVNVLLVPLPRFEVAENAKYQPHLTGPHQLDEDIPRFFSSVRVPFTLIPGAIDDPNLMDSNTNQSPFFTVYRTETYTTVAEHNALDEPLESSVDVTETTGISKEETNTFTNETGMSVSIEGGVEFGPASASVTVEMSSSFAWEHSTATGYSKETSIARSFPVGPHTYAVLVQRQTVFIAEDAFGTRMPAKIDGGAPGLIYLQWTP